MAFFVNKKIIMNNSPPTKNWSTFQNLMAANGFLLSESGFFPYCTRIFWVWGSKLPDQSPEMHSSPSPTPTRENGSRYRPPLGLIGLVDQRINHSDNEQPVTSFLVAP